MSRIHSKNTKPELIVRKLVHGMGYRYRLHVTGLPGKPDLVFSKYKTVVFVHGCFWHRHPDAGCKLARLPKSRVNFWETKLENNFKRDLLQRAELEKMGWKVFVIWECEIKDTNFLKSRIKAFFTI